MYDDLELTLRRPAACSSEELADFERLVRLGGNVTTASLTGRIRAAEWLALLRTRSGQFIGVGALKRPNTGYRSKVFMKARTTEDPSAFALELGWFYVAKDYRGQGLSNRLVGVLVGAVPTLGAQGGFPPHARLYVQIPKG